MRSISERVDARGENLPPCGDLFDEMAFGMTISKIGGYGKASGGGRCEM
jgi:hypothetical protein